MNEANPGVALVAPENRSQTLALSGYCCLLVNGTVGFGPPEIELASELTQPAMTTLGALIPPDGRINLNCAINVRDFASREISDDDIPSHAARGSVRSSFA